MTLPKFLADGLAEALRQPRVDYREFLKAQQLLVSRLEILETIPFPVLPNGDIDSIEARRILHGIGVDNATIVGTPHDYDLVSL